MGRLTLARQLRPNTHTVRPPAPQAAVEEAERTCSRIKAKELALEQLVGDGGTPFEMLQVRLLFRVTQVT